MKEIEDLLKRIKNQQLNEEEILEEMWNVFKDFDFEKQLDFFKEYSLLYEKDFRDYIYNNLNEYTVKIFDKLINDHIK